MDESQITESPSFIEGNTPSRIKSEGRTKTSAFLEHPYKKEAAANLTGKLRSADLIKADQRNDDYSAGNQIVDKDAGLMGQDKDEH